MSNYAIVVADWPTRNLVVVGAPEDVLRWWAIRTHFLSLDADAWERRN